jgi:metal-responsive CopG/Arc/MetJ family transcriptional regulator
MKSLHRSAGPRAKAKRIVIEFPTPLLDAADHAAAQLSVNRSSLIREALRQYVGKLQRQKLEKELAEGYVANAASARVLADELMAAERDLA